VRSINGFIGVSLVLLAASIACQDTDKRGDDDFSAQDSVATATELRASLEGGTAPGKQSYLYRGLYAGMTRAALESRLGRLPADSSASCQPTVGKLKETTCRYEGVLGSDSGRVSVSATFAGDAPGASPVAREITIARELPIAVDGVRVVRGLADAFAAQTTLLDRRESTYGHHSATVRMGTIHGERENYATVVVEDKHGREELTVTLARVGAPAAPPAPPARVAPSAPQKRKGMS
jgi:hypothetical protein